ncbi:hypothetical protein ES703_68538 [subsurface metagenome]
MNPNITINLPERKNEEAKKNLLNLSDEDLATRSPEELERIRRSKENLREIKRTDREVREMVDQERLENRIQEYMVVKGLARDQAELLVKQEFGLLGSSQGGPVYVQPKEDPITEALKDLVKERIHMLFPPPPAPGAGAPTGVGAQSNIAETLKAAREHGVNSLYLPDGTLLQINRGDALGDQLVKETADWVRGKLPDLFGGGEGKPPTELMSSQNPEIVKLGLEYRAKDEERKAAEIMAKAKTEAMRDFAAAVGVALSPEGFEKVKGLLGGIRAGTRQGGARAPAGGEGAARAPHRLGCRECGTFQEVAVGTPSFTCKKCGEENPVDWEE